MKRIKKILASLMVVVMVLTAAPLSGFVGLELPDWFDFTPKASAAAVTDSGICGDNLTWELYDNGELIISGTGAMYDYYTQYDGYYNTTTAPWGSYVSSIRSVTIQNGATSISKHAFYNCTSLTSITISDSVTSIGDDAFYNCTSLTSITVVDDNTAYSSDEYGVLFNKDKTSLVQYPSGNKRTSYTIPDSVTSIGSSAFYGCKGLTSIAIGDGVNSIGERAFFNCTSLTSITIPDSVTSISNYEFYGCKSLTSITIPDSVTSICSSAFYGCTSLTSITIPDSVTSIRSEAFYNCTSLTSITIPDSVTSIGDWAFDSCPKLVLSLEKDSYAETYANNNDIPYYYIYNELDEKMISVVVTSKLRFEINKETYTMTINCSGNMMSFASDDTPWSEYKPYIKHIIIAEGCEGISAYAFENFKGLKSIEISDSVTSIGVNAFYNCTSLTSITIPDGVTSIDNQTFLRCTGLTSITIPDSVTSIGSYAFSDCTSLTSITIPDSVTSIGFSAFYDCTNLGSITLPYSVSSINNNAFTGCKKLEKLKVYNKNCTFDSEIIGYYTTICGYAGSTAEAYADEMGYDFELIFDGDHEHIYSNNCDAECNICGHTRTDLVHTYSSVCDVTCDLCTYKRTDVVHTYSNDCDTECNVCGEIRTPKHTDNNTDGICDVCEKALSDILVGVTQNFKVKAGETVYIKFVPANSGVYTFFSSSSADTYGYIFDSNKNQLASDDDSSGNGNNFLITYTFKSGTVYYLGVKYYNSSNSGEIPVTIRLDELICDHNHTHEEHQDSTCSENGYDKVICDDCGQTVSTTELPLTDHALKKVVDNPTCEEAGAVIYYCSDCSYACVDEHLDPLGHSELVWVTVKVPSTRNEGIMNQICPVCGEVFDTKTVPAISLSADSTANIDFETNTISGFVSGSSSIDDYLSATNNGYTFTCESEKIATGTVITLTAGEDTINEFEAVIFGDTNGDSWYDGQDAIIVDCLANGMLKKEDVGEAVYLAADCNHDGVIDQLDVALLNEAGTLLSNVDQSKPTEVLLETSAEYVEYLDLIDQSPELDIEDETDAPEADVETEDTTPEQDAKVDIFEMILNFIKSIFEMLFAYIPMPLK